MIFCLAERVGGNSEVPRGLRLPLGPLCRRVAGIPASVGGYMQVLSLLPGVESSVTVAKIDRHQ